MRPTVIAIGGGAASGVAVAVTRVVAGYAEGIAFFAALAIGTLTIGVFVAVVIESPLVSRSILPRLSSPRRCHTCRGGRARLETLWVCDTCDWLPIDA